MLRITLFSSLIVSLTIAGSVTIAQNVSTFLEYIATDPDLSALNGAIVDSGFNASGRYGATVFAPTDDAFANLDITLVARLFKPGWSQHLANLLLMHISDKATYASYNLTDGEKIVAKNWENLTVSIEDGNVLVSSPNTNNSLVVEQDIWVVEGVVHKVDHVLLPQFITTDLLSLAAAHGFNILVELLELTGLTSAVESGSLATVFAPTDDAFLALGEKALTYYRANIDIATKLVAGRVIKSVVLPTREMVNGTIPNQTAALTYLNVTVETFNGTKHFTVDNATISPEKLLANNGIIHSIDAVLAVPGTEYPTACQWLRASVLDSYTRSFGHSNYLVSKNLERSISICYLVWFCSRFCCPSFSIRGTSISTQDGTWNCQYMCVAALRGYSVLFLLNGLQ
jgi:uncharacterized surface protein with fasciclin (FAS1) repeats